MRATQTATQKGRLDCRLALEPEFVESGDGSFVMRRLERTRVPADQEPGAREYIAGYRACLRGEP